MIKLLVFLAVSLSACSQNGSLDNTTIKTSAKEKTQTSAQPIAEKNTQAVVESSFQPHTIVNDDCAINFSTGQKHLEAAPCLTLPIKMSDFSQYPKLENGYLNLDKLPVPTDNREYIVSGNYESTRVLGIIPYDKNRVFLLLISNSDMEGDGFGQTYDLKLYNRKNGSYANGGNTYIGRYSLLYEEPLNYLYDTEQSFKFSDISHIPSIGYCKTEFEIKKDWEIIQNKLCTNLVNFNDSFNSTEYLVLNIEEMYFEQVLDDN